MSELAMKKKPKKSVTVSTAPAADDPWASGIGVFENTPMLDAMWENIREYRRKLDHEEEARQQVIPELFLSKSDVSERESENETQQTGTSDIIRLGKDHPLADAVGSFRDEDSQAWLDAVMEHIREQRRLDREKAEEESRVSS